jgi:hypothetical protein
MIVHPSITIEVARQRHADLVVDAQRQRLVRMNRGRTFQPKASLARRLSKRHLSYRSTEPFVASRGGSPSTCRTPVGPGGSTGR